MIAKLAAFPANQINRSVMDSLDWAMVMVSMHQASVKGRAADHVLTILIVQGFPPLLASSPLTCLQGLFIAVLGAN